MAGVAEGDVYTSSSPEYNALKARERLFLFVRCVCVPRNPGHPVCLSAAAAAFSSARLVVCGFVHFRSRGAICGKGVEGGP